VTVTGFWHAGITVSDLDASLAFYVDTLGLELVRRGPTSSVAARIWCLPGATGDVAFVGIPGTDTVLELTSFAGVETHPASARPCDPAHGHICLYVEDLDALHARVVERGYTSRAGEVLVIPDGPLAGAKAVYLIDPDGFHVELFERPGPQPDTTPAAASSASSASV
jgi:catechol 2,3-dioxygenase-like lactoylglutathione lyase family enzyme